MSRRLAYGIMATGGVIGLAASFVQMLEKLQLLGNADKVLVCNINAVFNCSTVLTAWQSSVFGFPNALMCIVFFTIFSVVGLAGASGGSLHRGFRLAVQALALLVLGFALWFLWQSIYVIGSLCILCLFCFAGLLFVNGALLRINAADVPIGTRGRQLLARFIQSGADVFVWLLLAVALVAAMMLRFL